MIARGFPFLFFFLKDAIRDLNEWPSFTSIQSQLNALNLLDKFARGKARRIIWFCGGFSQRDRNRVLKHLPEYRKYAIVWEQNVSDMRDGGYERPTSDEGFDEFTYIVS